VQNRYRETSASEGAAGAWTAAPGRPLATGRPRRLDVSIIFPKSAPLGRPQRGDKLSAHTLCSTPGRDELELKQTDRTLGGSKGFVPIRTLFFQAQE
jgi:hypothetical protein